MFSFPQTNKKQLQIGIVITGLTTAAYIFWKIITKNKTEIEDADMNIFNQKQKIQEEEETQNININNSNQNNNEQQENIQEKLEKICEETKISYLNDQKKTIQMSSLERIMIQSVYLSENAYISLNKENRISRRSLKDVQFEQYIDCLISFIDAVQNILEKNQKVLCEKIGCSEQSIEDSISYYMEENNENVQAIYQLGYQQQQEVKKLMPHSVIMDKQKMIEIFDFQLQLLKSQQLQNVIRTMVTILNKNTDEMEKMQKFEQTFLLYLTDEVYQKFKIEEEDIINYFSKRANDSDTEIYSKAVQFEQAINQIYTTNQLFN